MAEVSGKYPTREELMNWGDNDYGGEEKVRRKSNQFSFSEKLGYFIEDVLEFVEKISVSLERK